VGHYAKVKNSIVQRVIVADADYFNDLVDIEPGAWIKTSFNTKGGVHYEANTTTPSGDQSKALRKNFAGPGWIYDKGRDAFYEPQPFASWTLNDSTCLWDPPVAYPDDGKVYNWNETTKAWDEV
ncbi:uncharacterized protein METZ01_LOCUS266490, partial [marine metagenome]